MNTEVETGYRKLNPLRIDYLASIPGKEVMGFTHYLGVDGFKSAVLSLQGMSKAQRMGHQIMAMLLLKFYW